MFHPWRCPYPRCRQFADPEPDFCTRHGSYKPRCRSHPVPRFRCKTCRRTFSRQTFRMDYRDHRPHLNGRLYELLVSGVGLRQSSRILRLSPRCLQLKARKIGRHLRRLNRNVLRRLTEDANLQMDELETYEGRRNTRPLSVPVLIEAKSRFIIWAESATIRPRGTMTKQRLKAIAEDERRFGRRVDRSQRSVRRTLQRAVPLVEHLRQVVVSSDEKTSYVELIKQAFGGKRIVHQRTNSKFARGTWNPLFPINHTEAMTRDQMGRLRRESWLVSKRRRYLDIALHVFIAYRNLVRPRFNHDKASPAELLGFLPRRLTVGELLSWRQDAGALSPHPLGRGERWTEDRREAT